MKTGLVFTIIMILFVHMAKSQEPSRWRGPMGNGIYPETGLLKIWPTAGPSIVWTYDDLGEGFSSPAFTNDAIFVTGMISNTGYVFALSQSGRLLWKKPYGPEFSESYPGSRGTPTVAGDHLYIYTGFGLIVCMKAKTGDIVWTKDVFREFGGRQITWGVTESLVVDGDKLFVTPGGVRHNVVALNRFNGNLVWSSNGMGEKSAYCTPLLIKHNSRALLITHTESHIMGFDATNGKMLWSHEQRNRHSVHANTPIYHDGAIFYFSGYGKGGGLLKLSADGNSVRQAWFSETMDNRMGGAVLVDGYIYGSGDANRYWMCLDWETGEVKYQARGLANGTVISAEGMLYGYTDRGELFLARASSDGLNIISQSRVVLGTGQHWAHPVINNGRLFVRRGNSLIAYKIK